MAKQTGWKPRRELGIHSVAIPGAAPHRPRLAAHRRVMRWMVGLSFLGVAGGGGVLEARMHAGALSLGEGLGGAFIGLAIGLIPWFALYVNLEDACEVPKIYLHEEENVSARERVEAAYYGWLRAAGTHEEVVTASAEEGLHECYLAVHYASFEIEEIQRDLGRLASIDPRREDLEARLPDLRGVRDEAALRAVAISAQARRFADELTEIERITSMPRLESASVEGVGITQPTDQAALAAHEIEERRAQLAELRRRWPLPGLEAAPAAEVRALQPGSGG